MEFFEACSVFAERKMFLFETAADSITKSAVVGLSDDQIITLTEAIVSSGEKIRLPRDLSPFADIASTGGPSSLTTLLCPILLAAVGIRVPKLSATGSVAGGIDSMGIVPGFRTRLSANEFTEALMMANIAHGEPSDDFCPADAALVRSRRKSQMMSNPFLAAASLLAKKLAIPRTCAYFDFRVGPTGNIGRDYAAAREAGRLFLRLASRLGIRVGITLTDNRSFLSSAVGRLESLDLLWSILNQRKFETELDHYHFEICKQIAIRAHALAVGNRNLMSSEKIVSKALHDNKPREIFSLHLLAQGSSLNAFYSVLDVRQRQDKLRLYSTKQGYWLPPDIDSAKKWIQKFQTSVETTMESREQRSMNNQVGLRLLVTPGTKVEKDQPVAELSFPKGIKLPPDWEFLIGSIEAESTHRISQLIEHF